MFLNFKKDKFESIRSGFATLKDAFAYAASSDEDCKTECQEKIIKAHDLANLIVEYLRINISH